MPNATTGLRHIALVVADLEACERFYTDLLSMRVEWRPDADNVYLTSGHDNLALHRASAGFTPTGPQRLDHVGFILNAAADVDAWYEHLRAAQVPIKAAPHTHRDGARSFYCMDPAGNVVQMMYHPSLAQVTEQNT